jgi:hypothetical protein
MSVALEIADGDPWYLSPDIWVVPGTDPDGPPGLPFAGEPAYLWARVHNTGDTAAANVRLDYYWADPSLQVTRANAHLVGSAFATVPPQDLREVLCLVPWQPVFVNDGHECLVVVATHPADPLPVPLPDAFDPPTYPQVAQKNLSVLPVVEARSAEVRVTIGGLPRADKLVVVTAEIGGELSEAALAGLGLAGLRPARGRRVEAGLRPGLGCVAADEPIGERRLEVRVPRGTSSGLSLAVRARDLAKDEYQLVDVVERDGDAILGGLAVVVVSHKERSR